MRTTHVPSSPCPSCGTLLDAATGVADDVAPDPGSITVCIECGTVLVFDAALTLRRATDAEVRALPPEAARMVARFVAFVEQRR